MRPWRIGIGTRMRLLLSRRVTWRRLERERLRRGSDPFGQANGVVSVGPYLVRRLFDDQTDLMAVLRHDAMTLRPDEPSGPEIVISMPGRQVAERLDLLGMDEAAARAAFDGSISRGIAKLADRPPVDDEEEDPVRRELPQLPSWIRQEERDALLELDSEIWITRMRTAAVTAEPELHRFFFRPEPEDFWWLFHLVTGYGGLDDRRTLLRLILLVFPDEQVTVRIRHLDEGENGHPTEAAPSKALRTMQDFGATYSPDSRAHRRSHRCGSPSRALSILYPYLDDLVRFMEFDVKPEGSASGCRCRHLQSHRRRFRQ